MEDHEVVIQQLQSEQESLVQWMERAVVTTDAEQKNAEDILIGARYALKQASEKRMELTRPLDDAKRRIIDLFKPYITRLERGIDGVNRALVNYHNARRIEAQAIRMAQLAEEAARLQEAAETGEIVEPLQLPVEAPVPTTSRTNLGSVNYREDFTIQVVRADLVPRDLCEPSMTRIRARVKSGVRSIPGVVISRTYVSTTRRGGGKLQ